MTNEDQTLWDAYNKDRSDKNRNALFEQYDGCIRIAAALVATVPTDYANCYQHGCVAMLDSIIPGYDEIYGVKFTTFAIKRLHYYIQRSRGKEDKHFQKKKYDYSEVKIPSMIDDNNKEYDPMDSREEEPGAAFERADMLKEIGEGLNDMEKDMLVRYFWQGKGYTDIGREIGMSMQAVHQRIGRIFKKLKNKKRWM